MTESGKDSKRRLAVTEPELEKLKAILQTAKSFLPGRRFIELLDEKLEDAEIVSPSESPADVVDVGRTVRFTDLDRSEEVVYKLVFPRDAKHANNISVLTPLGSALLGSRVGEVIEIHAPRRTRKLRIDAIVKRTDEIAA